MTVVKSALLGCRLSGHIQIIRANGVKLDHILDSTGAGDTFVGYFLANLAIEDYKKQDINLITNAFKIANSAAALSCTKNGAMESIPTFQEVEYFMKQLK